MTVLELIGDGPDAVVRLLVMVVLAGLLVAGCSDDDSASTTTSTVSTTTTVAPPTSSSSTSSGSATSSSTASTEPSTTGCRTGDHSIPAGAATGTVVDVDGDGQQDTGWIVQDGGTVTVGVATSAGGGARREFDSASPVMRSVLVVDVDQDAPVEILADDGRSVQLWEFAGCDIVDVRNAQGDPYVFSLGFTDVGTGVGCVDSGGHQQLVGLDVTSDDGTTVEWTRTVVHLEGGQARNGETTKGTFTRPGDAHAIDLLHRVTCGDRTIEDDGITLPR